MNITAQYANVQKTSIIATIDEKYFSVPVDDSNRHFQEIQKWVAEGNEIAPSDVPAITNEQVKAERQRRIYQIANPDKQAYYSRLMISWLEQGKETWTPEQIAQVEAIRAGNAAIDAIVAKASLLEAMDPVPADYQDDKWWTD